MNLQDPIDTKFLIKCFFNKKIQSVLFSFVKYFFVIFVNNNNQNRRDENLELYSYSIYKPRRRINQNEEGRTMMTAFFWFHLVCLWVLNAINYLYLCDQINEIWAKKQLQILLFPPIYR